MKRTSMSFNAFRLTVIILIILSAVQENISIPSEVRIATLIPSTYNNDSTPMFTSALKLAIELINNDTSILPNTTLVAINFDTHSVAAQALTATLEANEMGLEMIVCCLTVAEQSLSATASTVLGMPMLGYASDTTLSNKILYPYFSRIIPSVNIESIAILETLKSFHNQTKISQYKQFAVICATTEYGLESSKALVLNANAYNMTVKTYQQFISQANDISVELNQLVISNARVFVAVMDPTNFRVILAQGRSLFSTEYVWFCTSGCASSFDFLYPNFTLISKDFYYNTVGIIASSFSGYHDQEYEDFAAIWRTLNTTEYPGAGLSNPDPFTSYVYDAIWFYATAIDNAINTGDIDDNGKLKDLPTFVDVLRSSAMNGVTGYITLDEAGDRTPFVTTLNLKNGSESFTICAFWNETVGLLVLSEYEFYGGVTTIPDISINHSYTYWDCNDRTSKVDPTGRSVTIYLPDASNPSNIAYHYYCDNFIDCENFSDESSSCSSNYEVLFIVFGVITGVCIIICFILIIFTIIFGIIIPKVVVRASSPIFMIILLISCIVGLSSIYAWYGKPEKVACGFQPWLLGLPVTSMVSCLCSKTFRIWRIFKFPMKRKVISDLELIVFWIIMMIPALLLLFLWTLISTPTTKMDTFNNDKHLVCDSGGFTGYPGGYIFFALYVAYTALIAFFGAFLSIVTRKVPSLYNESKLIAICIYNLVFLSIIIIPCVLVLNNINPFVSWIIRSVGILYAFVATVLLQFTPKIIGVALSFCSKSSSTPNISNSNDTLRSDLETFRNIPEASQIDDN